MYAASQKGQDHQQQQADSNGKGGEPEALDQEVVYHSAGPLAGKLLGDALLLIAFPLVATLFDHFFLGDLAIEDDEVHGELLGTSVGVEEMDREDEAGSQERLVGVDDGGNVEGPAGQEQPEELGEPEHQAGSADGEHTPEDRDEVEFLPVGPALEGRLGSLEEEPSDHEEDILDIAQIEAE